MDIIKHALIALVALLLLLLKVPWVKTMVEPAGFDAVGNELVMGTVDYRRWHPGYWLRRSVCKPVERGFDRYGNPYTIFEFAYPRWNPLSWFNLRPASLRLN